MSLSVKMGFAVLWITNTIVSGLNPFINALLGVFLVIAPSVIGALIILQNNPSLLHDTEDEELFKILEKDLKRLDNFYLSICILLVIDILWWPF